MIVPANVVSIDRVASILGAMLLVIVSWLSARTLDRIDALSDQVQAMSVSLLQVPELAATVREHDHRLAVLEARGLIVSPLADRQ